MSLFTYLSNVIKNRENREITGYYNFRDEYYTENYYWLAVWLSGNALASINVVALRQTRLVLGWVTVCGRVNHFDM